jgi:hypothetical protein
MRSRFGKPTTAGYVALVILSIIVAGIVVGVIIGGGTGFTIDAIGGVVLVIFIFLMVDPITPRRPGDDPRDQHIEPPGPGGLH